MDAKPREISITLRMDDQHEVRAVRRLLKALLRRFGLKCTRITPADDQEPPQ